MIERSVLKLGRAGFIKAENYIMEYGRPIDKILFAYYFQNAPANRVLHELEGYLNEDGGFGKGLELDFLYPGSTPLSIARGLQILFDLRLTLRLDIALNALEWLYKRILPSGGWLAITKEVNDFPRACWWQYQESAEKRFTLDPTIELAAYFYHFGAGEYRNFSRELIDQCRRYLADNAGRITIYEALCTLRFIHIVPDSVSAKFIPLIKPEIDRLLCTDEQNWDDVVLTPLQVVDSPIHFLYNPYKQHVDRNINYIIKSQQPYGYWQPNWNWGRDNYDFSAQLDTIRAKVTLDNLRLLKSFDKLRVTL